MNQIPIPLPSNKISISPTGLQTTGDLTLAEWKDVAPSLASSARSLAFVIGDWFHYGTTRLELEDGQPSTLEMAMTSTGLDAVTLQMYAHVARCVPYRLRSQRLSWDHHRVLAKLPEADQAAWIAKCIAEEDAGRRMTLRRLRKSVNLGRIATAADLEPDEADQGIENHITHVNRLTVWWKHMEEDGFLKKSTPPQRWALKIDLLPVVQIYNKL